MQLHKIEYSSLSNRPAILQECIDNNIPRDSEMREPVTWMIGGWWGCAHLICVTDKTFKIQYEDGRIKEEKKTQISLVYGHYDDWRCINNNESNYVK